MHPAGGKRSGVQALADGLRGTKKLCQFYEVATLIASVYTLFCIPAGNTHFTLLASILAVAVIIHVSAAKALAALEQICEQLGLPTAP